MWRGFRGGSRSSVEPLFVPPEPRAAILAEDGVDDKAAAALLGIVWGIANGRWCREDRNEQRRAASRWQPPRSALSIFYDYTRQDSSAMAEEVCWSDVGFEGERCGGK
jgi:hypothetical protein